VGRRRLSILFVRVAGVLPAPCMVLAGSALWRILHNISLALPSLDCVIGREVAESGCVLDLAKIDSFELQVPGMCRVLACALVGWNWIKV